MSGFKLLTAGGILAGVVLHQLVLLLGGYALQQRFGLDVGPAWPTLRDVLLLGCVFIAGLLAGCVPAYRALRQSLADGMTQRL